MTLDQALVEAVDGAARRLGMTMSAFTHRALGNYIPNLDYS